MVAVNGEYLSESVEIKCIGITEKTNYPKRAQTVFNPTGLGFHDNDRTSSRSTYVYLQLKLSRDSRGKPGLPTY